MNKMGVLSSLLVLSLGLISSGIAAACPNNDVVDAAVVELKQTVRPPQFIGSDFKTAVINSGNGGLQVVLSYEVKESNSNGYVVKNVDRIASAQFDPKSCKLITLNEVPVESKPFISKIEGLPFGDCRGHGFTTSEAKELNYISYPELGGGPIFRPEDSEFYSKHCLH